MCSEFGVATSSFLSVNPHTKLGEELKATNLKRQTCDEFIDLSGNQVLGNKVDFMDITSVFPNILAKNQNFKKLRHCFVDERAQKTATLTSFWHWKILVPFCLRKKKPEKAFLILTLNYRKNCTEKKIMPFKTTVTWLFNDIWCYLVIGCFD